MCVHWRKHTVILCRLRGFNIRTTSLPDPSTVFVWNNVSFSIFFCKRPQSFQFESLPEVDMWVRASVEVLSIYDPNHDPQRIIDTAADWDGRNPISGRIFLGSSEVVATKRYGTLDISLSSSSTSSIRSFSDWFNVSLTSRQFTAPLPDLK